MSFAHSANNSRGAISKRSFEQNKLEYEQMRQRLLETEEKLQNLCRLEEEVQSVASETSDRLSLIRDQRGYYKRHPPPSHRDDVESLPSAISTVPGSYTGFIGHKVSSSTPNMKQKTHQPQEEGFESDTSSGSLKQGGTADKYGHKLLRQNQRLLLEVEHLVGDLHAAKVENANLLKSAESGKKVADLEDKIEGLVAESRAQDKALREAEKHIDESCKRNSELEKKLEYCRSEIADLRAEIEEHKESKKVVEDQRDEAIQNYLEMQESWEDYQRKTKEKIKKMEETEDSLQDKLAAVSQERDNLFDQLAEYQTSFASQEAQINRLLNDVELEDARRQQAEFESTELQQQLDQLTGQICDLEAKLERATQAEAKKRQMEAELEVYRQMMREAADIIQMVQHNRNTHSENDSGNVSIFSAVGRPDAQVAEASAVMNVNNNGSEASASSIRNQNNCGLALDPTAMSELRTLFYNMEAEINRLKACLKQKTDDERTYQTMREEVNMLMEKVEAGMSRNQELEKLGIEWCRY